MTVESFLRAESLRNWYFVDPDRTPPVAPPEHPPWMSPFLFESPAPLEERMTRAGALWASNLHFSSARQLVLCHPAAGSSYVFRKALAPGERHLALGPISARLLETGDPVLGSGWIYAEGDEIVPDRLLAQRVER